MDTNEILNTNSINKREKVVTEKKKRAIKDYSKKPSIMEDRLIKVGESRTEYKRFRIKYNEYLENLDKHLSFVEKQKNGEMGKIGVEVPKKIIAIFDAKVKEKVGAKKNSYVINELIKLYINDFIINPITYKSILDENILLKANKDVSNDNHNTTDYDNLKATIAQLEEDKKMMETLLKGQPSTSNDPFLQSEITRLNNELVISKEANEIAQEVSIENDCEIEDLKMKLEAANNTITNLRGAA